MKQTERILDYMKRFGSITPVQALADLGVMRLGARIWDLKDQGVRIKTETEIAKNRYGEPTHFAKYSLEEVEGNGQFR